MHQAIVARAKQHKDIIHRVPLRFIRSSSSPLPPQVMKELEDVFAVPVIEAYAMTALRDVYRRIPHGYRAFQRIESHYHLAVSNAVVGSVAGLSVHGNNAAQ